MRRIVQWFSTHKISNILVLILYFVVVVAPHKRFGTFLNTRIFKGITRDEYNLYVLIGALLMLAIYGLIFILNARKRPDKNKLWFYMVINIIAAFTILNTLFVINIEVIHFPQYALFAILLFPLVGNYTATLIWSTLAGAIDEAYQYFYLAPLDTSYYDLNDVITNLVGAVFGLLLLRSLGIGNHTTFRLSKSTIWYGIGFIFIMIVIAHLTGQLSIYPNEERPYHILREWPPGFWSTVHPNVTFHVVKPLEGLIITCLLWVFYARLSPKPIDS